MAPVSRPTAVKTGAWLSEPTLTQTCAGSVFVALTVKAPVMPLLVPGRQTNDSPLLRVAFAPTGCPFLYNVPLLTAATLNTSDG